MLPITMTIMMPLEMNITTNKLKNKTFKLFDASTRREEKNNKAMDFFEIRNVFP